MKNLKRLLEQADKFDTLGQEEAFEKVLLRYERKYTKMAKKVTGKRVYLEDRIQSMLGSNA